MANQEQLNILKQGVEVWNKWRQENIDTEINLSFSKLENLDLSYCDLSFSNLDTASLKKTNLTKANLIGAGLLNVNLTGANLTEANLTETYLEKANLQRAKLNNANLQKANLSEAKLQNANLQNANLKEASLILAKLQFSNLQGTNLEKSYLLFANLRQAKLQFSKLREANLLGANLQETQLQCTNLYNANLENVNLKDANLYNANLECANLERANLYNANLESVNLENTNFTGTIVTNSSFFNWSINAKTIYKEIICEYFYIAMGYLHITPEQKYRYPPKGKLKKGEFSLLCQKYIELKEIAFDYKFYDVLINNDISSLLLNQNNNNNDSSKNKDFEKLAKSQQDDFITRIKTDELLNVKTKGLFSELIIINKHRLEELKEFCWEMAEKYKTRGKIKKLFINNLKGKLGEEVVKKILGSFVTEVDYEIKRGGDGKVDFFVTNNSDIGIQVKTRKGDIDSIEWFINEEEKQKNKILICILSQEEINESQEEYHLIFAGFIPTKFIEGTKVKADELWYGGCLRCYLLF